MITASSESVFMTLSVCATATTSANGTTIGTIEGMIKAATSKKVSAADPLSRERPSGRHFTAVPHAAAFAARQAKAAGLGSQEKIRRFRAIRLAKERLIALIYVCGLTAGMAR